MKKLVLIDSNNMGWKSFHKYKGLSHGKHNVSMIFGFPSMLTAVLRKFQPDKTICVWDCKKSEHRLEVLPEYKGKRKFSPDYEEFMKQKEMVQSMLNLLGIPQVHDISMEADDYIYMLAKIYKQKGWEVVIVSSDKDFKQCIDSKISVWDSTKNILLTSKNLRSIFGYTAKQTIDLLILNGDDSDNIKGYRGMGDVRCREFFDKFDSITSFLESEEEYKHIQKPVLLELYKKNSLLVNLKYFYDTFLKGKIKVFYLFGRSPEFKKEEFLKVCRFYKIKTFQQKSFLKIYE